MPFWAAIAAASSGHFVTIGAGYRNLLRDLGRRDNRELAFRRVTLRRRRGTRRDCHGRDRTPRDLPCRVHELPLK